MNRYFVTGTDTDAGKTLVAAALLARAKERGRRTLGLKPVASGCEMTPDGLRNRDALMLQRQSEPAVSYAQVNPYAFEPAIAPHLAAARAGNVPDLETLIPLMAQALATGRDLTLIEGAGGWRVPLNETQDLAGLARALDLPVILVVGVRLGCISHARLTQEAVRADGLHLAGWVANQVDANFSGHEGTLDTLAAWLDAPCLGIVPWLGQHATPERAAAYLRLPDGLD
ncbi:dethiobiotin synthase [Modicisalibacter coralii]|uniref:dethiobiotin synthase n=1 Tax=Modicisalibacter coralii TaxID=2304602 RepID=UPI00100BCFE7|nr:dethiobiotin synthase [Halomonas coralii]